VSPVANMRMKRIRVLAAVLSFVLIATACSDEVTQIPPEEAEARLQELVEDTDFRNDPVSRRANVPPPGGLDLSDTIPSIDEFPLVVDVAPSGDRVAAEIFVSTEKSGEGTDGWMVEAAEEFNRAGITLSDGRVAQVEVRKIASGTGYQFIAAGESLPAGFSPSNHLWIEMAGEHQQMTPVSEQLVPNVAGIVMKTETAEQLQAEGETLDAESLIEAVIAGEVVMGYTDPFASSTGLNFLLTVLDTFAEGQEDRLVDADVASVFEQFQQQVPFVALTTLQIRESVEKENGTLDAFVMEWQTFVNTDTLDSGFEFIPFGIRHDNPLYAVGDLPPEQLEVLEEFATFASGSDFAGEAARFGFDPPAYESEVAIPSGDTLIQAQRLWKDKKDGGRPVAAVFVTDVSGSMAGSRLLAVQQALRSAREFISPGSSVGMVEFSDAPTLRLPIAEFDLNQQGRFAAAIEDMNPTGGTAMYDGVALGLSMLLEHRQANPDSKLLLFVLTDGETNQGMGLGDIDEVIAGLRVPIYTVGFEADLDELGRVSSLVEAASINASEDDVEFKMAALFNAGA
jgi:Ca-activated chloride channel family protein